VDGRAEGPMEKAQKVTVTWNGKTYGFIGTFKNGVPVGEVSVQVDSTTVQVQSPFTGSEPREGQS